MPRNWNRAVLAALALTLGAGRKPAVDKLFDCEVPSGWTVKPLTAESTGFVLSDGVVRITAVRHEGPQARFASPAALLKEAESLGGPFKKAGMAEVSGRVCARYQRRSERRHRIKGRDSSEYLYEELVLRPDDKGFWALKLQSAARTAPKSPRGLQEWQRFLATFRPLGPPS